MINILKGIFGNVVSNYGKYILIAIILIIITYITMLRSTVGRLENRIEELSAESIVSRQNLELCNMQLEKQNMLIEQQKQKYIKKVEEYEELKKVPKKVRYKTIYKTIYKTKKEKASNECKDVKSVLDAINNAVLNSL